MSSCALTGLVKQLHAPNGLSALQGKCSAQQANV